MPKPLHFALIAGELSGDLLGASLLQALRVRFPDARFSGVVGPKLRALGCAEVGSIDTLSLMGIVEVLPAIPKLLRFRRDLLAHYRRDPPDLLIGIDAPDFNLGLERRMRQKGVRTAHLVSPSVWAWREGRVEGIAQSVDLMLCLLPFEPAFYAKHAVQARYIGHPLADTLSPARLATDARAQLLLAPDCPTLAVLPGSRNGEVAHLARPFAQTVAMAAAAIPKLQVVTPIAKPGLRPALEAAVRTYAPKADWRLVDGQSNAAMQAADAVLIASGTATLECLLLGRPMVVGYRVAPLTAWLLRRLVKVQYASLPNLLSAQAPVPECLQEDCTPEKLLAALLPLLDDAEARLAQTHAFDAVRHELKRDASQQAAAAIAELLLRA
jgi:lipid-A-disaccharide synthase